VIQYGSGIVNEDVSHPNFRCGALRKMLFALHHSGQLGVRL
jgi:hypothetical protein